MARNLTSKEASDMAKRRTGTPGGGRGGRYPKNHEPGDEACPCSGCLRRAKWRNEENERIAKEWAAVAEKRQKVEGVVIKALAGPKSEDAASVVKYDKFDPGA